MQTETGEIKVEKVQSEKDLGVIFDQKLKFTEHIISKGNKANRNVGLIFRTFTFMDKDMFLNLYKSVVRPHLEYASTIWYQIYKKRHNPNRKCATSRNKCIKHLPYEERLITLGLPSLEYRRDRADLIQVYKIMHGIDKIDKDKLFTLSRYRATCGHSLKLYKKWARLKVWANSARNSSYDSVTCIRMMKDFCSESYEVGPNGLTAFQTE